MDLIFYALFLCNCVIYIVIIAESNDLDFKLAVQDTDYFEQVTELSVLYDLYVNINA